MANRKNGTIAVRVRNVSKRFQVKTPQGKKTLQALDGVSLDIRKGEIFGLLGPNGAGKTTLISILMGLLEKDSGQVEILGFNLDTNANDIKERANVVSGFVQPLDILNGRQLLNYYALLYGIDKRKERIDEVLEYVGMTEHAERKAEKYSSGQRQRLFIARALLNRPQLLFLDEPTVGLDVRMARKIRALVRKLRDDGATILLTTHYMKEAEELCDRVALVNAGKIVALDTPANLKKRLNKAKGGKGRQAADLEDVFMALTRKEGQTEEEEESEEKRQTDKLQGEESEVARI
jgi:ABC-2 type transport system ATP-binding protein